MLWAWVALAATAAALSTNSPEGTYVAHPSAHSACARLASADDRRGTAWDVEKAVLVVPRKATAVAAVVAAAVAVGLDKRRMAELGMGTVVMLWSAAAVALAVQQAAVMFGALAASAAVAGAASVAVFAAMAELGTLVRIRGELGMVPPPLLPLLPLPRSVTLRASDMPTTELLRGLGWV